jgi:hypothetical protein
MGCLAHLERNFTSVGWFIPPYMQLGILSRIAAEIQVAGKQYTQRDLEGALARLYEPEGVLSMASGIRWPQSDLTLYSRRFATSPVSEAAPFTTKLKKLPKTRVNGSA